MPIITSMRVSTTHVKSPLRRGRKSKAKAAPTEAMAALRHFHDDLGDKIWGRFGFIDGFSEQENWYADSYLAISQGPIVVMIENYRSGLIWKLFMSVPEIREGMKKLGFKSPHFASAIA